MRSLAGLVLSAFAWCCLAGQATVENVRMWPAPDHTRIVFDIDGPLEHTLFILNNPDRVVVDLRDTRITGAMVNASPEDKLLSGIRHAARNARDLRVVFDLHQAVRPRSFLLKPNQKYGYRLVVDLYDKGEAGAAEPSGPRRVEPESPARIRDLVIAIDPGHGGEDPGTIGARGTREKDVVFAISRELKRQVDGRRGFRAVLLREGDYYLGLRKRMDLAREHRADLFVSIHADSFKDPRVRGSAVYVLSRNGASSEAARWLAEQENAADLVGGVSLDDKDELLASVLLDLSQTATLSASSEVGGSVLSALRGVGKTHKRGVERAGFAVLKSPDIPSILVETAFLSNPQEEVRLKSAAHQRAVAAAITRGIFDYFENNPPPGTLLASRNHTIARGETLSRIARRYRVSVSDLQSFNGLDDSDIRVGQTLRIPPLDGG